jgi:hypothetical protein
LAKPAYSAPDALPQASANVVNFLEWAILRNRSPAVCGRMAVRAYFDARDRLYRQGLI